MRKHSGMTAGVTGESRAGSSDSSSCAGAKGFGSERLAGTGQGPGLDPGTDPATDPLRQLPALLAGAGSASTWPVPSCSQPGPGAAGALLSASNPAVALSKGSPRLERCERQPGTGGLPPARWGQECHFSATIYCHISSRISSNLQHKLKTKKKNPPNSVIVIRPELTLPGSWN